MIKPDSKGLLGMCHPFCVPKINVLKHHEEVGHLSTKLQTHTHTLCEQSKKKKRVKCRTLILQLVNESFSRSLDGKLISQLSYLYGPKYICVQLCVFSCASTCFGLVTFLTVL
jgi:hypothetical protein